LAVAAVAGVTLAITVAEAEEAWHIKITLLLCPGLLIHTKLVQAVRGLLDPRLPQMMVLNLFLLMLLLCLLMGVKLEMYRLAAARAVQVPLLILVVQEVMDPVLVILAAVAAARLDMRVTAVTEVTV
jgi:hypothetical protein